MPERVVQNAELAARVETSDAWVRANLGITERRICSPHETTSVIAAEAGFRALRSAGIDPTQLDLIVVATATPDRLAPSTACLVQECLGAVNAAAFDLAAVCSGFVYALSVVQSLVECGRHRHVLVIGADTFSRITDWNRRDCVFFGDGAGAVVVRASDAPGILHSRIFADGRGKDGFSVPRSGSEVSEVDSPGTGSPVHFAMNSRAVFDAATTVLPAAINTLLSDIGLSVDDVDLLVPHQPSIRVLTTTAERLGLPIEKVAMNMQRYANTAAATVPLLLDELNQAGRIHPGNLLILAAVGSGWTWGAVALRWTAEPNQREELI